jgi:hypothetical protein
MRRDHQGTSRRLDDGPLHAVPRQRGPGPATSGGSAGRLLQLQALAGNRATRSLVNGTASGAISPPAPAVVTVQRGKKRGKKGDDAKVNALVKLLESSKVASLTEEEVQVGLDLWLSGRAGNVHDVDVTKHKAQKAGEVSGGVGGGAYARGAVAATRRLDYPLGLTPTQYQALAELGAFVGVEGKAAGQVHAKIGPAYLKVLASAKVFAGAVARAGAKGHVTFVDGIAFPVGFGAEGSASASVGVRASAEGEFTGGFLPHTLAGIGVAIHADVSAFSGAEVSIAGKGQLDLLRGRIVLSGEFSPFVGAKVEGSIGGSAMLYGRKAFKIKGKGLAATGAGGEAKFEFSAIGGKLTLKFTALGALGAGLGAGADLESDFKPLAVFIWRQAAKAKWAAQATDPDVRRKVTGYQQALDADVRPQLVGYRDLKIAQLRVNDATNYVKIEKVQAILDWHWPRTEMRQLARGSHVLVHNIDRAIETMIKRVFEEVPGFGPGDDLAVVVDVVVSKGQIKSLQTTPRELHVLLGGGIEGKHAHGADAEGAAKASKANLTSDVGKL